MGRRGSDDIRLEVSSVRIKFLGTGGGRFTMIHQRRATGGMVFYDHSGEVADPLTLYIDPGPGALVYSVKEGISLEELDGLIVTHAHLDHCNDAEAIIEAMTNGCKKERGVLIANSTILRGAKTNGEEYTQVISDYHQNAVECTIEVKEQQSVRIKGREIQFFLTEHGDPNTMAFKIDSEQTIGFITDTDFFEGINTFFSGCDYLVMNVLRPVGRKWEGHLNIEDAANILNAVTPDMAILKHFGYSMLYSSLKKQEEFLENKINEDTKVLFAEDFQEVDFEKKGLEKFV